MPKLWLTYAWKDNEAQDIDHVIHELKNAGLEVRYDRAELLAGQRLWQQIDSAINDPTVDAWAIYVTENSLRSEPCQEEIAYALDRALRGGPEGFPIIGIFPRPVDRALIPSAIATRLYVNLAAPDWQQQILDGVSGHRSFTSTPPLPFGQAFHDFKDQKVLEVWPRSGRWYPFVAAVPLAEKEKLKSIMHGPRGGITGTGMVTTSGSQENETMAFEVIHHAVDTTHSAHIFLAEIPTVIEFGQPNGPIYGIKFPPQA